MTDHKDKTEIEEIDCQDAIGQLYAYLDNEIQDTETLKVVEHHLEHCHSCFTRAEVERALNNSIQKAAKSDTPETLQNRLKDLIDKF